MKTMIWFVAMMGCLLVACVSKQKEKGLQYRTSVPGNLLYDPNQDPYACHRMTHPFPDLREIYLPLNIIYRAKSEQKIITVYMRDASTSWGFEKASWATNFAGVSKAA